MTVATWHDHPGNAPVDPERWAAILRGDVEHTHVHPWEDGERSFTHAHPMPTAPEDEDALRGPHRHPNGEHRHPHGHSLYRPAGA